MRVAAGACARAGGSAHHRADSSARTAIDAIVALTRPIIPLSFWLERCAHRELDVADFFLARRGRVETVVDPDRTEGRDLAGLEAANGIRPAEEVALEERHRILRPSELVPRGETPAQDVVEPQRLVLGDGGGDPKEAVVTGADAREVGAEEGEGAPGRLMRVVARVASERAPEHRHDGLSLGGQEL